jgi:hypothetical protein
MKGITRALEPLIKAVAGTLFLVVYQLTCLLSGPRTSIVSVPVYGQAVLS